MGQPAFIERLLIKMVIENCNSATTTSCQANEDEEPQDHQAYQSFI